MPAHSGRVAPVAGNTTRHASRRTLILPDRGGGFPDGELCIDSEVSETAPPPGPGCDAGFSVSAVTIEPVHAEAFRLVDLHPPSGNAVDCRRSALVQVFEGSAALARGARSVVAGDFNLDPFAGDDASERYFREWGRPRPAVPASQRDRRANAAVEVGVLPDRKPHLRPRGLELRIGSCKTLGEAAGTERLDGGSGTDHRALLCQLRLQ